MRPLMIAAAALFAAVAGPAAAEIVSRSENAFTLKFTGRTALGPAGVPTALSQLPLWWDPAHSYSGDATNLSLDLSPGGCWCEKLEDGTDFDHGRTLSVVPGEMRFHAPFGPLRSMATKADLVVTYPLVDGVVTPTWTFVVEGPGVGAMADPVDAVMAGGFSRWIGHMNGLAGAGG
ncbi:MAG: hypothetical protein KJ676_10595 [Alphaproteobacteria bacterium]|nr:hypothetical protein [Alphaproteobacteria bacterium]MBU1526792.1 hypothetical protein [Alphaproteobacteria bacterium]MBU2116480.1 hypothetical protein [Alphaproteobacteria bacterium]MBU2351866.1 hypothetical protein [Alphaproteobacteria bacterium]MBU2381017.1 hypothetical protein [Alphaproteobacteria bacterium]